MNASTLASVLADHRRLLLRALPSFERSLSKCQSILLDKEPLSFEAEESFDSLTSKFARISDIFTQKLLKSLVLYLREDAPTFLDRMNLCEKLGIIPSAESMLAIRDLRNLIAHEYSVERITEIYAETLDRSKDLLAAIKAADNKIGGILSRA
jgi:hypothetical protein